MTPWTLAEQWQQQHDPQSDFALVVGDYLANGCVHAAPDSLWLFRACHWDGANASWEGEPNAWFIHLAVRTGGPSLCRRFVRVAPHPLPWVLWCRNNDGRLRVHDFNTIMRRTR